MAKLLVLDGRPEAPRLRPSVRHSRYTHLVAQPDGGAVAWNALSGDLSLWDRTEVAAYEKTGTGQSDSVEEALFEKFRTTRHTCDSAIDEVEIVRSLFDRERYGEQTLTLAVFARGPESLPAQAPMSAAVRGAVAGLCNGMLGGLKGINALWTGHEPLAALFHLGDLSLRLSEIAAGKRVRYVGAVQTDGEALTPAIADKLPGLDIKHVEIRLRTNGGARNLPLVIENLRAAAELGALDLHLRLETHPDAPRLAFQMLDQLAAAGLTNRPRISLSLGGGVFQSCHRQYGLTASGPHGTAILEHANRIGLSFGPALPHFLSQCQAVRSLSYAVGPAGDLHKCWETVSNPSLQMGNATDLKTLQGQVARRPRWMIADPFSDPVCRSCSILPLCTGHCADQFPLKSARPVSDASDKTRPCPDVKFHLDDRILAAARIAGLLPKQGVAHG